MIGINVVCRAIALYWVAISILGRVQSRAEYLFRQSISNPMPDTLNENDVTFIYYNRENKNGTKLNETNISVISEGLPLVVVTHGWKLSAAHPSVQDIVKEYLDNLYMNIIAVDWSPLASSNYVTSSYSTRKAGRAVGDMVVRLCQENICALNSSHLIGHSLGAHVMGVAGYRIQEVTGDKIFRITGLDPAGPLFEYLQADLQYKLDSSDGAFVDIIHSNPLLGYVGPLGDVDFFPNGDSSAQPGCIRPLCSHLRSYMYFAESIGNKEAFQSTQCSSFLVYLKGLCDGNPKTHMGQWTSLRARGNYYLITRASSPFSK